MKEVGDKDLYCGDSRAPRPGLTDLSSPGSRMLVHICCGPCSVYPLKTALKGKAEVWGFFHNPNIHPLSEFKKRLSAVKALASYLSINLICDEEYRGAGFVRALKSRAGGGKFPTKALRCGYCYSTRLEATAKAALENGFDSFSSSLLYSRYQDHDLIRGLGVDLGRKWGILFYYEDFREGWQKGIEESREMGLYRQWYCGCIYSKVEREAEKKARSEKALRKRPEVKS